MYGVDLERRVGIEETIVSENQSLVQHECSCEKVE